MAQQKDTDAKSFYDREFEKFLRERDKERKSVETALGRFKERTKQELTNTFKVLNQTTNHIKETEKALEDLKFGSEEYLEATKHLEEQNKIRAGLQARSNKIAEQLQRAGEDRLIEQAKDDALDQELAEQYEEKVNKARVLRRKRKALMRSGASKDKLDDLDKEIKKAEEERDDLGNFDKDALKNPSKKDLLDSASGGVKGTIGQVIKEISKDNGFFQSAGEGIGGKISDKLGDKFDKIGTPLTKVVGVAGKILDVVVALRANINTWVDDAARVLSQNVGRINAALEGTGKTYESSTESMIEALGMSRYVKQTDYIQQIAQLTAAGVSFNVEQRALLETIKDKTIASFSSMDGHLLRLIRLRQQDLTATQFGLEAALRNTLNKVFKDSSYLRDMYDSIASAITDSVVISGAGDVTAYSSVIQTWMGAMYESGVDSSMVSKIANALNNLGSGNVSALASDQDIQRLVLLSMDTIGMDYADILQQGLTTSDINDLLTAIVKYLTKIESNTKDNNVLTSSYTQLFGMSMSDLQAFKNLSKKMGSLTSVDTGTALAMTNYEIEKLQSTERTIAAEQIDNFFANTKFTFGNEIAKDTASYMTWKVSNLLMDISESVAESAIGKTPVGKLVSKGIGIPAGLAIFGNTIKGLLGIIKAIPSAIDGGAGGLQTLINGAPTYGGDNVSTSATITTGGEFKTVNLSSLRQSEDYTTTVASYSGQEWESTDEGTDPVVEELQKFESVLVTANADASHKALATFLVGMTDDTLRSFASIFADEDSMSDTFTGKNEVLKDNMFKYAEDTSSNSKKTESTPKKA